MRCKAFALGVLAALGLAFVSPYVAGDRAEAQYYRYNQYYGARVVVPAGTAMNVRLDQEISTKNSREGQGWAGTVTDEVRSGDGRVVIPAGSRVFGNVTTLVSGTTDQRATIGLGVRRVEMNGESHWVSARTEPIVAGSQRAKRIGATVGGAVVGGLLGRAVGGKLGTIIGGAAGGYAGYRVTKNRFRSMELDQGTVITFTTSQDVIARL